jgi:hypothetical protein
MSPINTETGPPGGQLIREEHEEVCSVFILCQLANNRRSYNDLTAVLPFIHTQPLEAIACPTEQSFLYKLSAIPAPMLVLVHPMVCPLTLMEIQSVYPVQMVDLLTAYQSMLMVILLLPPRSFLQALHLSFRENIARITWPSAKPLLRTSRLRNRPKRRLCDNRLLYPSILQIRLLLRTPVLPPQQPDQQA